MSVVPALQWPEALDVERFLGEYWQRKALWMPEALPGFTTPLSADELAGLSLEADVAGRLLLQRADGRFSLEHGPFAEDRFDDLSGAIYSLLVADVDKHLPVLSDYLRPFDFLPSWRMDDLMISYAPDGGSVGAHIDAYDVFLLQASGSREWFIDTREQPDTRLLDDSDVRQLAQFSPTESRVLTAGDILYLPPGVPHHGIARGDHCTTWSIGFRAPNPAQLVLALAERMAHGQLPTQPVDDPALERAHAGEISTAHLAAYREVWRNAAELDDAAFTTLLGQVLTTHGEPDAGDETAEDLPARLRQAPWARLAWAGDASSVTLFANGEPLPCSRSLAEALCTRAPVDAADWHAGDRELITALFEGGVLVDSDVYG